ncbi:MAG TPA: hypothetical protein PLL72_24590, partial [Burkholderiaceae bacterium]|nr:hypothetical protein [Burkholderiaceae bacterium]
LLLRRGHGLPEAARPAVRALDAVVIADTGERIDAWLAEQGLAAVVLRPDRYVYDAWTDRGGLADLAARLAALCGELGVMAS